MPNIIIKNGYIKSSQHFINYMTYAGEKFEAQTLIFNDGRKLEIGADDIIDFSKYENLKYVQVQFKDGNIRKLKPSTYQNKTDEETDVVTKHTLVREKGEEIELPPADYLWYMSHRPSVEYNMNCSHGLFGINGVVDIEEAKRIVLENEKSVKWSPIISLKRADAERVGFNNRKAWESLLKAKAYDIAKLYNISPENLVINASFHKKDDHPHLHLFIFSKDSREGFITGGVAGMKNKTEKLKSLFNNSIFKDDVEYLKKEKNQYRQEFKEEMSKVLQEMGKKEYAVDSEIVKCFSEVSNSLLDYHGKPYYEFMAPSVKKEVDFLLKKVIELDPNLKALYQSTVENQRAFISMYSDAEEKIEVRISDFEERFFHPRKKDQKTLHNIIVKNAMLLNQKDTDVVRKEKHKEKVSFSNSVSNILPVNEIERYVVRKEKHKEVPFSPNTSSDNVFVGEFANDVVGKEKHMEAVFLSNHVSSDVPVSDFEKDIARKEQAMHPFSSNAITDKENFPKHDYGAIRDEPEEINDSYFYGSRKKKEDEKYWTSEYKQARHYLYGNAETPNDLEKAYPAMLVEAKKGNPLAMHDIGKMNLDGVACDKNVNVAQEWFEKALSGFLTAEQTEERTDYFQYRIGKMYSFGYGTTQDYEQSACWYEKSTAQSNRFAAYSLGNLYRRGQGVERNDKTAFDLFEFATTDAKKPNAYAMYELGGMCKKGIGTTINKEKSNEWYKGAYLGFCELEKQIADEKLLYRLGKMNLSGIGTDVDFYKAEKYLTKAADFENVNAFYGLGQLYSNKDFDGYNMQKAIINFNEAAQRENSFAQFALGKIYLLGKDVPKDVIKGIEYLTEASYDKVVNNKHELGNQFAQYTLGKLYLSNEDVSKDINKAIKYLTYSAEQDNQFAQYTLGKLYLSGEDVPKDIGKAIECFSTSAEQDNQFAQYALGKLYLADEDIPKDVDKAIEYLTASAAERVVDDKKEPGNQFAQYTLGKLYLSGEDFPKDVDKAMDYLMASAGQGNDFAEYKIGMIYYKGVDVIQDKIKAKQYFEISASNGNEYASEMLRRMKSQNIKQVLYMSQRVLSAIAFSMSMNTINNSHTQGNLNKSSGLHKPSKIKNQPKKKKKFHRKKISNEISY